MNEITIRESKPEDAESIVRIKIQAFGSKLRNAFTWDELLLEKMTLFFLCRVNHTKIIAAEYENEIIGFIVLKSKKYPENHVKSLYRKSIREFGFLNTVKYLISALSLEFTNLKPDECYINQIAVAENGRGKGIGSMLMDAGEAECRNLKGVSRYTLYVMKENTRAHKLYSSLGFIEKREDKFPLLKFMTGYSSAIFMEKIII